MSVTMRPYNPWTPQEQLIAEVAAACGVSFSGIGRTLGRSGNVVRLHISSAAAEKNRERSRRWNKANPGKLREKTHRWAKANSDRKLENARRYRSNKRTAGCRALVPLTGEQRRKRYALFSNRCAFCGVNAKHPRNHGCKGLTEEHALALSKGGLDEASNILPICKSCNCSKSATPIEEWYCRQPFFSEARWRKIKRFCPAAVIGQLPLAMIPETA